MRTSFVFSLLAAVLFTGCATQPAVSPAPANAAAPQPAAVALDIPFKVITPEGNRAGPFPGVVIMHDCSGLGPRSSGGPARWAKELVAHDYIVIIPDSFTTRGFPDGVCTNPAPNRTDVGPARRIRDAYDALAYLRTLPNVDGARIGIMGGSHGGATTLATMAASNATAAILGDRRGFAAAVALYPSCGMRLGDWRADGTGTYKPLAPLLILSGELDDWTPAAPCEKLTAAAQRAGYPVSIKVYPGAHHSFDSSRPVRFVAERVNSNAPGGRGATTGGNAEAWADSIRQVIAFFDRNLTKTRMN